MGTLGLMAKMGPFSHEASQQLINGSFCEPPNFRLSRPPSEKTMKLLCLCMVSGKKFQAKARTQWIFCAEKKIPHEKKKPKTLKRSGFYTKYYIFHTTCLEKAVLKLSSKLLKICKCS